jgi:hypothetical protein
MKVFRFRSSEFLPSGDVAVSIASAETNDMGLRRPDAAERATLTVRAITRLLASDKCGNTSIFGGAPGGA